MRHMWGGDAPSHGGYRVSGSAGSVRYAVCNSTQVGRLAQLAERADHTREVAGSSPASPTIPHHALREGVG